MAAFDASTISAVAMIVVAIIEAVAARDRKRVKQERAQLVKQQQLQEQLMLKLIEGNWAAMALGEATAKAVQRIPDSHCNGDMHEALEYAGSIKHSQKEFLAQQGIHAILDVDTA